MKKQCSYLPFTISNFTYSQVDKVDDAIKSNAKNRIVGLQLAVIKNND
jgi:CubicO group peptidase (beta-lactamase class C family)